MKKYFLLIAFVFLLTGCTNNQPVTQKNKIPDSNDQQTYQEIETNLTDTVVDDLNPVTEIDKEIKRLQKNGGIFWHDQNHKTISRLPMYYLQFKMDCKNDIKSEENCSITGLQAFQNNLPPDFKVEKCNKEGWCLITDPLFPKVAANKIRNMDSFYGFGKDIYSIGSVTNDDGYSIFENEQEIFSHKMFSGGKGVIRDASIVLDSPAFTFYDLIGRKDENNPIVHSNIFYKGETLNEKYNFESSSYLFAFKDKIGFVGQKDGGKFLFFNGQKISQDFDEIRTDACCAITAYPIEIDENGILFFMGKRGEKYFFTEINLNEYLK